MSFAMDLQKFAEKTAANADEVVGAVVVGIAARLDERSPVGDATYWISPPPAGYVGGRFRGNWQLGIGEAPTGVLEQIDTAGTIALPAIIAQVPEQAAGKVYYLTNNLPYSQRIEEGWSRQAPTGLVGLTVVEYQQIVREVVETVQ